MPPSELEALRERYARLALDRSPDGTEHWLNWAVWCVKAERHIGYVQATLPKNEIATIAYVLFSNAWGEGFAVEAVVRMIDHLVDTYHPVCLRATVDVRNTRSIRLLDRLGFSRQGVRKNAEQIRGIWCDDAEYRKYP
jgi:[ribosomal protein S5]-alanine N-acetyltransferase